MRIVERIKDAVEHTADSWQQKLLNEYNASDEPAARARKIISELVKQLDKPNQVIINDIVSLIYALASNPDPSIDMEQVITTAEMLIHELVEPIPNPDKKLMDELLHLIIHTSSRHSTTNKQSRMDASMNPSANMEMQTAKNTAATVAAQQTASQAQQPTLIKTEQQSERQPLSNTQQVQAPKPTQAPQTSSKAVDAPMIKLIMDEMKEVIKKNQFTEQRLTEVENKLSGRVTAVSEEFQGIKEKLAKQEADLDSINKNLDKFISLYEVVINQYNPFIEHIDEPKKTQQSEPIQESQNTIDTPKRKENAQQPAKSIIQPKAEESPPENDIHILIDQVRGMTDESFVANKEKTAKWIINVLRDVELAKSFAQTNSKAQAIKLLLKKSLD